MRLLQVVHTETMPGQWTPTRISFTMHRPQAASHSILCIPTANQAADLPALSAEPGSTKDAIEIRDPPTNPPANQTRPPPLPNPAQPATERAAQSQSRAARGAARHGTQRPPRRVAPHRGRGVVASSSRPVALRRGRASIAVPCDRSMSRGGTDYGVLQ